MTLRHHHELPVELHLPNEFAYPHHQMVFEDALMELVENVRGDGGKDVYIRELGLEWIRDRM